MIRKMETADLEQVCAIETLCFSVPWTRAVFQDSLSREEYLYFVAVSEGQIAGYCGLLMIGEEGDVVNVAVHPDWRKQGIGENMLETLLQAGHENGISAFTLEVRVGNTAAIHLYEKTGFVPVGVRRGYYEKPQEDALIMWKR